MQGLGSCAIGYSNSGELPQISFGLDSIHNVKSATALARPL